MIRTLAIALVLTLAAGAAHAADVYRWVDAQGGVHYTDTWVPGSTLIKVDHRPHSSDTPPPNGPSAQSKALNAGARASAEVTKDADERAMHADVAQAQEAQCKQAKNDYNKAISSRRIWNTDKDGQRQYLSEADADAYRLQKRTDMQNVCGSDTK
jgi:hypothetical protein